MSAATVEPAVGGLTQDFVRKNPKLIRRAVILAGILGGLQTSDPIVATLALPKAGKALDMTTSSLALAASISTLFLAATVVLMGSLSDHFGRLRTMFWLTVALIVGDLIVVMAPTTAFYMLGRAIAGIAVGGVLATAYAYLTVVSPPKSLGSNLGLWGAICAGLAVPVVVIAAGFASLNWRFAFLIIPMLAVATLPFQGRTFPKVPPNPERKQLWGVSLAGLGVVGILYGISKTADKLVSPAADIPILAGIALIVLAGVIGLRSSRPAYPVRIFRSPVFVTAAIAGALWNLAMGIVQLQSSNLWQYVNGLEPFVASVLQLPLSVAVVVGSLLVGRLLGKGITPRWIMPVGFLIVSVGLAVMSVTGANPVSVPFNLGMVLVGFGAGYASVAQSQILLTESPPEYVGPVAASRTTFGQIGYAIGLAASAVLTASLTISAIGANGREELNSFFTSDAADLQSDPALAAINDHVAPIYTQGFQTSMLVWSGVFIVGAVVCFILMSVRKHPLPGCPAATASVTSDPGTSASHADVR